MKKISISLFIFVGIFLVFLGYIFFVVQKNSVYADVFSILHSALIVIFLSCHIGKVPERRRFFYIYILLYVALWLASDIALAVYDYLFPKSFIISISLAINELASVFIIIAFIYSLFKHTPQSQKKQLLLDLLAITVASYFLLQAAVDVTLGKINGISEFYIFYTISVFSDVLILFTAILTIPWIYKNFRNYTAIINLLGILLFTLTSLSGKYITGNYMDIMYMISPMLFSISIFCESRRGKANENEDIQNLTYPRSVIITVALLIIAGIDMILYRLNVISANNSLIISYCITIYLAISINYQNYLKSREAISQHRKIEEELEKKIAERTAELKENHEMVLTIINKDLLTGTGSRRCLLETLYTYDNPKEKYDSLVIIIDILKFKNINYMMSHNTGDKILIYVANKLKDMFSEGSVYRTDSNEFAILISNNSMELSDMQSLGTHIMNTLQREIVFDEVRVKIEVAVGYDLYSDKHTTHAELLSNAEYACKVAKNNKIKYQFYNEEIYASLTREVNIESLLTTIDYDSEFYMNFQPQFTTDGKALVGMEALIRWNNPQLGFVSPGEFIPIAERSDIIIHIIKWTITKCIKQIKDWNEKYNLDLKMAVNISPKYISTYSFMEDIQREIQENNIKYSWLDLELTETSIMGIEESIISIFSELNNLGISTSIDDFGTGYSSLSYLKHFKIRKLKIAKELIDNITNNENEKMIVKSIIMMSEALNIYTIAEGVETAEQRDILMDLNCNQIQGYYYGKPVSAKEFEETYLKKQL